MVLFRPTFFCQIRCIALKQTYVQKLSPGAISWAQSQTQSRTS